MQITAVATHTHTHTHTLTFAVVVSGASSHWQEARSDAEHMDALTQLSLESSDLLFSDIKASRWLILLDQKKKKEKEEEDKQATLRPLNSF